MKKFLRGLMVMVMATAMSFCFVGCGDNSNDSSNSNSSKSAAPETKTYAVGDTVTMKNSDYSTTKRQLLVEKHSINL